MYDPACVRCVQARRGGYNGCAFHNSARVRYVAPATTVVVTDTHHHHGYGYESPVGVDITDGDPVLNMGGGIGVDMRTGDLEIEVAPNVYVDVDPSPSCDNWGGSDW